MFGRFLPRRTDFFDFFEEHARLTASGIRVFVGLTEAGSDKAAGARAIKRIENQCDAVTHRCIEALHKTFITPIERDSIYQLITVMDDIIDIVEATSERIVLYELQQMRPEVASMGDVLARSMMEVEKAVGALRSMKHSAAILRACVSINELENEADALLRSALARLFREEKDPLTIIKWKEIFEYLEDASDRCEDVAQIIEGVVLEHA
jgi:hypothetical protein